MDVTRSDLPAQIERAIADRGGNPLDEHLADLRKSGLADDTIASMEVRSLTAAELAAALGYVLHGVQSALALPYPGLDFVRYKLFPPAVGANGHSMRYTQREGSGVHLYIPPPVRAVLTDASVPLHWSEGEKKTWKAVQDALHCLGLGGLWNWLQGGTANGIAELEAIVHVERDEIIVPDSDVWTRPDLLQAVYAFGRELEARGARVSVVIIPAGEGGAKVGLDDFLAAHGPDAFRALTRIPLRHPAFTKQREWYPSWRDSRAPKPQGNDAPQGTALTLSEPEPWPEPVDGAGLLDEIAGTYSRFVVLPPGAADSLALWMMHTYCVLPCFNSPYVSVSGPTMRCGKTRTLEVADCLVCRPLLATCLTPATLFRTIDVYHPTFLIDEKDTDPQMKEELRGLLNAGHRAGARVPRCVGESNELRWFSVFGPKAIAGIGRLHGTTEDRAIQIRLKRRKPSETIEPFRRDRVYVACDKLRRMAVRWSHDNLDALQNADPDVPTTLNDRAAENWRPLLAIADRAGGKWPRRARDAARLLSGQDAAGDDDLKVQLLTDLRRVFDADTHVSTEALLNKLNAMADRPWPEWTHGKPLTARGLAKLLRPFGIVSKTVRLSATETPKGYDRADFDDAFSRYLPSENATTPQPAPALEKVEISHPPQAAECGASGNATSPYNDKACGGVADTWEVVEL